MLTVDANAPIAAVSPTLYGLMTEEINHSYDGGLYAEMVRNRNFIKGRGNSFDQWFLRTEGTSAATMEQANDGPSTALANSLRLNISAASAGNEAGMVNAGWWGFAVKPSTSYQGSFFAKTQGVTAAHVRLISDNTGAMLADSYRACAGRRLEAVQLHNEVGCERGIHPGEPPLHHLRAAWNRAAPVGIALPSHLP